MISKNNSEIYMKGAEYPMARPKILQDISSIESINTRQDSSIDSLTSKNTEQDKSMRLVGRYLVPTVTSVSGNSTPLTTNPIPTTWTGSGNAYSSGQYAIESSVPPSGANPLANAFDGNVSGSFMALVSGEGSITITLPTAINVKSFKTYILDKAGIDQVMIEGSTNKTSWTTLYTYSGLDTELTTRNLSSTGYYKYYRFRFTMDSAATIEVREIQIGSYTISTLVNNFTLADIPSPLETHQRIMVKTPEFSNTGVTRATMNTVEIDTVLLPNRYYELIYDGTRYLAKEVV